MIFRLSRARRVVENAFGILAARWRIFRSSINGSPNNVEHFTRACIVLHNLLIDRKTNYAEKGFADYYTTDGQLVDGTWRTENKAVVFQDIGQLRGMNYTNEAKKVRDTLAEYFMSPQGSVP